MSRFVVGDIHGCLEELRCLIESLPMTAQDELIFLGDYIDRGPDSRGVISYLIWLRQQLANNKLVFLKGNHEEMLQSYLGIGGDHGDMFLINGGKATMASYGLHQERPPTADALSAIPPEHIDFYQDLYSYYVSEDFLCVHAGIHPEKSLEEQTADEIYWIRNKFIYSAHPLPYTVVFGHTPQAAAYFDLPYKIGIDTGLVYGNMLTCLDVDAKVLHQIAKGKKRVNKTPVSQLWLKAKSLA